MVSHLVVNQLVLIAMVQTLAMVAGLTDHVWSVREMLLFRVPLWPQPAGV